MVKWCLYTIIFWAFFNSIIGGTKTLDYTELLFEKLKQKVNYCGRGYVAQIKDVKKNWIFFVNQDKYHLALNPLLLQNPILASSLVVVIQTGL